MAAQSSSAMHASLDNVGSQRWANVKNKILGTDAGHVSMSVWAFRFLLWYICIMLVQPQNRYTFLWPLHIANVSFIAAVVLHVLDCLQSQKPLLAPNSATGIGLFGIALVFISNTVGVFQDGWGGWNAFVDLIVKNFLLMIMLAAMCRSVERVWVVQMVVLFSTTWWLKSGLRLSAAGATYAGDRLMGATIGLIENPNSFAYMLCLMLPIYLYAHRHATRKWLRWLFLGCVISALYIIFKTGSRTGMVTLLAIGSGLLFKYGKGHWGALAAIAVAVAIILPFSGERNIQRFKTIPDSALTFLGLKSKTVQDRKESQDEQSANERSAKNRDTWRLIKDYPLFGVGMVPDQNRLKAEGYPMATGQVHCEILMVGKQMGMIGMALYVFALAATWWCGGAVMKRATAMGWSAVGDMGWTFRMQAIANAAGGFFCPIPWHPPMMIMVGSAIALWAIVKNMPVKENVRAL